MTRERTFTLRGFRHPPTQDCFPNGGSQSKLVPGAVGWRSTIKNSGFFMMMPHRFTKRIAVSAGLSMAMFLLVGSSYGKNKKDTVVEPFLYQAGTEKLDKGCGGKLEVLKEGFSFTCPGGTFTINYSTITLMQYRPDVSPAVLAMKIPWVLAPQLTRVRENKYFTIVANEQGKLRVVVLRVDENNMRPYFAEIELQSGKSVQEFRSYEEFQ